MTQSRKDALQALLAKVKADNWNSMRDEPSAETGLLGLWHEFDQIMDHGSLDAALALHNAVLPTAQLGVIDTDGGADVRDWDGDQYSAQFDGNPARAWLCAILQALIAECDAIKPHDPRR